IRAGRERPRVAGAVEPREREEARHERRRVRRQEARVGELPERRARTARERAIDARLAGVVGGEGERPVVVPLVEQSEVPRGGVGRPVERDTVVARRRDDEAEAAGRARAELPEPELAGAAAEPGPEAALDRGQQRE